jgi:4-hydroxybenzoate polyprenyltransferase
VLGKRWKKSEGGVDWGNLASLTRPRGALLVPLLPLLALWMAHWDRALRFENWDSVLVLILSWFSLHCGTMWLNAVLDQDQGAVLFGSPCEVPANTRIFGYGALVLAIILSFLLGFVPGLLTILCSLLAVLYSHPRTRWKGHGLAGPLVNLLGYGFCSPLIGWWVADVSLTVRAAIIISLVPWFVLGCYLLAQSFQEEEDRARGYATLVVTHGEKRVVQLASWCFHLVFIQLLLLAIAGWLPRVVVVVVLPYILLARVLSDWQREPNGRALLQAEQAMSRLTVSAIVLLLALLVHQAQALHSRGPSAGLGTAFGYPADRLEVRARAIHRMESYARSMSSTPPS